MARITKKTATIKTGSSSRLGTAVRLMTTSERIADMREFGREQARSKATARAFLQSAGIITPTGKLTKPYRNA